MLKLKKFFNCLVQHNVVLILVHCDWNKHASSNAFFSKALNMKELFSVGSSRMFVQCASSGSSISI